VLGSAVGSGPQEADLSKQKLDITSAVIGYHGVNGTLSRTLTQTKAGRVLEPS